MDGDDVKKVADALKTYVKPTVTKHTAASLVVGSGCGNCGQYVSQAGGYGGGGLCGLYITGYYSGCYYH